MRRVLSSPIFVWARQASAYLKSEMKRAGVTYIEVAKRLRKYGSDAIAGLKVADAVLASLQSGAPSRPTSRESEN